MARTNKAKQRQNIPPSSALVPRDVLGETRMDPALLTDIRIRTAVDREVSAAVKKRLSEIERQQNETNIPVIRSIAYEDIPTSPASRTAAKPAKKQTARQTPPPRRRKDVDRAGFSGFDFLREHKKPIGWITAAVVGLGIYALSGSGSEKSVELPVIPSAATFPDAANPANKLGVTAIVSMHVTKIEYYESDQGSGIAFKVESTGFDPAKYKQILPQDPSKLSDADKDLLDHPDHFTAGRYYDGLAKLDLADRTAGKKDAEGDPMRPYWDACVMDMRALVASGLANAATLLAASPDVADKIIEHSATGATASATPNPTMSAGPIETAASIVAGLENTYSMSPWGTGTNTPIMNAWAYIDKPNELVPCSISQ